MLFDRQAPLIGEIDDVLTRAECAAWIARIEAAGPTDAPITTSQGFVMRKDVRNNTRVIFDDDEGAAMLFDRVRARLPAELHGAVMVGANERLRCYRYERGQRFAPHFDGRFVRDDSEQSELSLIIYLNDEFGGGETRFTDLDPLPFGRHVVPKPGRALWFQHQLRHEGCVVTHGTKYVLRSDVMYRRSPAA